MVTGVVGAYLCYQVGPDHAGLIEAIIGSCDGAAGGIEHTVMPRFANELGLKQWAVHGYGTGPTSLLGFGG